MSRLQGKRTLITGGTSGIGLETAKQFLAEGARVIVTGVNPESMANAQAILGSEVLVLRADSASVAAQKELAQAVQSHYGQLDVAFLNAGVSVWRPIEDWNEEMLIAPSTSMSKALTSFCKHCCRLSLTLRRWFLTPRSVHIWAPRTHPFTPQPRLPS